MKTILMINFNRCKTIIEKIMEFKIYLSKCILWYYGNGENGSNGKSPKL